MLSLRTSIYPLLACCALICIGCRTSETTSTVGDAEDTDVLKDLLGDIDLTEGGPSESSSVDLTKKSAADDVTVNVTAPTTLASQSAERLELRLTPGDRFPLTKTVRQTLTQKSQKIPAVAETQLELQMVIEVQQVRPDASLLEVTYTRVAYQQNINTEQLAFDSANHKGPIPVAATPYFGMVNNGFSFWLGQDNTIAELVGYDEFLQRCVQQVPAQNQAAMLAQISQRFGRDGVANFVDDVIGLLPFHRGADPNSATQVAVGDVWTRQRKLMQPTAVDIQSTCRLERLTNETATIKITGVISASDPTGGMPATGPVKINSGRTMGSCIVDRATGLPIELTRSSFMNLHVTTATGQVVEQNKRIETSIRTLPNARRPVVSTPQQPQRTMQNPAGRTSSANPISMAANPLPPYAQNGIQQTSHQQPAVQRLPTTQPAFSVLPAQPGMQQSGRIDTSHLKSTATAVYPD